MKILAVVPAYNEEECIEATISSLVEACPDVDYLVVNDGSKDATSQVCDDHGLNYLTLPSLLLYFLLYFHIIKRD